MYFKSREDYSDYLFDRKAKSVSISKAYDLLAHSDKNISSVIHDESLSPQEYIEVIALRRKEGYSQSAGSGNVSAEHQTDLMYKNTPWKFVEEFLQNADDCKYLEKPEIEIIVNENLGTVEFIYNEEGFNRQDVWALTAFEQSNKSDESDRLLESDEDGIFYLEKTGRKGIGFKSVFSLDASNIRIHIRSNEYSFVLDRAIGTIMPIWESGYEDDGKTHVTVELTNPQFSLKEIYPKFKEIFCVEETSQLFARNPVLFMHRLKDITVKQVTAEGLKESFSIILNYDHSNCVYERSFNPNGIILAGIRHEGKYYKRQFTYLTIQLKSNEQSITVPCVRETQMVDLDGKYRNISIIAPVIYQNQNNSWTGGALFRTFPMIDNTFGLPFAIDAPFELNTARKGIEYSTSNGARQFNNKIISWLFNGDCLLVDFLLHLRAVQDVQMDRYFKKTAVTLFENDANKDGSGKRLISVLNLTEIMKAVPVFLKYKEEGYTTYSRVYTVDPEIYFWLDAEKFLSPFKEKYGFDLASEIYSGNHILRNKNIVDEYFAHELNDYLDTIEAEFGIHGAEYLDFVEKQLYPFLKKHEQDLFKSNAYDILRVFISHVKQQNNLIYVRESCKEGIWAYYTGNNNLSFWKYRIVESSPVDLNPLMEVLKREAGCKKLDEELSGNIKETANKRCEEWSDARGFIESLAYYGYSWENLKIDILGNYAVSKEKDTHKSNYLRDAGILRIIPDEDIKELSGVFGSEEEAVNFLYNIGLRNWTKIGRPSGKGKKLCDLYDDSLQMLQKGQIDTVKKYLEVVIKSFKKNEQRIVLPFEAFDVCAIEIKLILIRNEQFIGKDYYDEICEGILRGKHYWEDGSNEYSELIIRARMKGSISKLGNKKEVALTLQYVIENGLEILTQKVLKERQFNLLRIINNGYFEEIPLEDIQNTTAILAPDKLESVREKKTIHFYKGNLSVLPERDRYLLDGSGEVVYLHVDDAGNYNDSLARYLKTSFDPDAVKYFAELEVQNRHVYESYIRPVFDKYGYDLNEAYHRIAMDFPSRTEEEFIQIISWFRKQSYADKIGHASKNNEAEIGNDYKDSPWKFVYEFIQNVDDCKYLETDIPNLVIAIDESKGTVSFTYNEVGFSREDIDALTDFGDSNKEDVLDTDIPGEGLFNLEKTGRKGRGFKSVFSLPGKDIAVSIESNGYSFTIYKRVGQIIPFWFNSEDMPEKGSRITINGFKKEKMAGIYQKLKEIFGIKNINNFFSDCPLLYLRKLKKILVTNGKDYFNIDIEGQYDRAVYSEGLFDIGNNKVVSGIRHANHYRLHETLPIKITVKENDSIRMETDAVRYSCMFASGLKTRTVSLTAPIITRESRNMFERGGLYCVLPLEKNRFYMPVAINAPFLTDGGRSRVDDIQNLLHSDIRSNLLVNIFPAFYRYIREIENISIEDYIVSSNDAIFSDYRTIQKINLKELTWSTPVFKLEAGEAYISMTKARKLPNECYKWIKPVDLAEAFLPNARNVLIDHRYTECRLYFSRIELIDTNFVQNLNQYIESIRQSGWDEICDLMREHIFPFITENFDAIRKEYRKENKTEELRKLRIFVFNMSDGSCVLESADEPTIWLNNCPGQHQSYGNYRVVNNSPVNFTEEQLGWIRELHEITDFDKAFTRNELSAKTVDTWEGAKTLIETVLYYGISGNITIPFLKECLLDEQFDPEENIFREAYKEIESSRIAKHCINEQDIIDIWTDVGDVWSGEPEDIANLVIQFGLRRGNEFFKVTNKTANCNEATLALFQEYCTTKEKAEQVLFLVRSAWNKRNELKKSYDRLIVEYESIKDCSPAFLTSLFNSDLVDKDEMSRLAAEFFNTDRVISRNADYTEALLYAARLLDAKSVTNNRELGLSLTEIFDRKLGKCIQDVMSRLESKLEFFISTDQQLQPYPNEQINKALHWLGDSERGESLSKNYQYYMTDIKEAFPKKTSEQTIYLIDSEKVILNASSGTDDGLYYFVRRQYGGKDRDFSTLMGIIREQERLKNWIGNKKQYIKELNKFRTDTDRLKKVLYPGMMDNINNANSTSLEYIIPELLQNINDCRCSEKPEDRLLQIDIDISKGFMKLTYDEDGFDFSNVYSITALGQSSKHDSSEGEKGLGFKKVFTLFDTVEIYSNDFFFSLSKERETIPEWIDDQDKVDINTYENGTVMVFRTRQANALHQISSQWENLFKEPYTDGTVSPLFLENIARYKLVINGKRSFSVARKDIVSGYHFIKKPLLKTYMDLLYQEQSQEIADNMMEIIRKSLKQRRKCKAMSKWEFEDYINNIDITICFPNKMEKKVEGVYFSTLPTRTGTNSSLFINLPLELTTGRDAVLQGDSSPYNKCIMDMVFRCGPGMKSVYGMILEEAAEQMPEKEIFEYICADITNWLDDLSKGDSNTNTSLKKELWNLKIFHSYPGNKLVQLKGSYSVDSVIYQYLVSGVEIKIDFERWVEKHYAPSSGMNMINFRRNVVKTTEALEKFVSDVKINEQANYYPLSKTFVTMVYDYFKEEY